MTLASVVNDPVIVDGVFIHAFVTDQYFSNDDYSKVSVIPMEGYKLYSEYHDERFRGFDIVLENKTLV